MNTHRSIRNQILAMNGFTHEMAEDKANRILTAILQESIDKFGFEPHSEVNAELPELTKYWYVHDEGEAISTGRRTADSESTDIHGNAEAFAKAKQAMLESATSSGGTVVVKIENPNWHEMQKHLKILKSAKPALTKFLDQGWDLAAQLKAKAAAPKEHSGISDEAYKLAGDLFVTKASELEASMATMDNFVKSMREKISTAEAIPEDCDVQGLLSEIKDMCDKAVAHQDGFKLQYKRMQSFLS